MAKSSREGNFFMGTNMVNVQYCNDSVPIISHNYYLQEKLLKYRIIEKWNNNKHEKSDETLALVQVADMNEHITKNKWGV